LKKLTDSKEESFSQISLDDYSDVSVLAVPKKSSDNKIAVVYLDGTIVDGQGTIEQVGGNRYARLLRRIRQDDKVKGVVIRINSPGGSATASDIILREVQLIREKKPVIISMGNVAASGGYWIATGGQHIFAESNTITGSIGVFGMLFNIQEIANNNGITWDSVKTAKLADLGTATRPKTAQELGIYQTSVNRIYDLFLSKVSQSRHLPKAKVATIAQGRVWSGEDAKNIGLVDTIGGLNEAINYTVAQTTLGEDWELQEFPSPRGLTQLLFRKSLDDEVNNSVTIDPLTQEFIKIKTQLSELTTFNDPKGIYSRLPFNFPLQ
jgi:protease-4